MKPGRGGLHRLDLRWEQTMVGYGSAAGNLTGGIAEAAARSGRQYDAVPYPSLPMQRLQSARLCAHAHLYGLAAAPPATARTLEIGCASGGHLIPLAAAFPDAQFTGVDVSAVQIAEAQARIARLGLRNIELSVRSFTELGAAEGAFDYVLCHGVYSWITGELREALLRVCKERLAPDGIAAVSFNVLPGWRMFQLVRDCLLLHAGARPSTGERIAEARRLFELLSEHTVESISYGSIWRKDAQRMARQTDAYLTHELFEENNVPVTFTDFAQSASRHGLAYLGETQLAANIPENTGENRGRLIRELGGSELHAVEQYIDIVTGRTFRQSLLVHAGRAADADRSLRLQCLDGLHFIASRGLKIAPSPGAGMWSIDDGDGRVFDTDDTTHVEVLKELEARLPSSCSLDELAAAGNGGEAERMGIRGVLMQLLCRGVVEVSTEPIRCAKAGADRPKVWPLAAIDAAAGMERTATLSFAPFEISPQGRLLLPLADGTRTGAELKAAMLDFVVTKGVRISEDGKPVADRQRLAQFCGEMVDRELATYARAGLLMDSRA